MEVLIVLSTVYLAFNEVMEVRLFQTDTTVKTSRKHPPTHRLYNTNNFLLANPAHCQFWWSLGFQRSCVESLHRALLQGTVLSFEEDDVNGFVYEVRMGSECFCSCSTYGLSSNMMALIASNCGQIRRINPALPRGPDTEAAHPSRQFRSRGLHSLPGHLPRRPHSSTLNLSGRKIRSN